MRFMVVSYTLNKNIRKFHVVKLVHIIRNWLKSNNIKDRIIIGYYSVDVYDIPFIVKYNLKQYLEENHPLLIGKIDIRLRMLKVHVKQ